MHGDVYTKWWTVDLYRISCVQTNRIGSLTANQKFSVPCIKISTHKVYKERQLPTSTFLFPPVCQLIFQLESTSSDIFRAFYFIISGFIHNTILKRIKNHIKINNIYFDYTLFFLIRILFIRITRLRFPKI